MKWKDIKLGDKRIKKRWAWFPVYIYGETRWMEYVETEQEYREAYDYEIGKYRRWVDIKFLN